MSGFLQPIQRLEDDLVMQLPQCLSALWLPVAVSSASVGMMALSDTETVCICICVSRPICAYAHTPSNSLWHIISSFKWSSQLLSILHLGKIKRICTYKDILYMQTPVFNPLLQLCGMHTLPFEVRDKQQSGTSRFFLHFYQAYFQENRWRMPAAHFSMDRLHNCRIQHLLAALLCITANWQEANPHWNCVSLSEKLKARLYGHNQDISFSPSSTNS